MNIKYKDNTYYNNFQAQRSASARAGETPEQYRARLDTEVRHFA